MVSGGVQAQSAYSLSAIKRIWRDVMYADLLTRTVDKHHEMDLAMREEARCAAAMTKPSSIRRGKEQTSDQHP